MNPKKRKLAILLSIIIIIIVALGGIGGKIYMDNQAVQQAKQKELKKNLEESKKEIIESLEWNYSGIHSVTFDYDFNENDGAIKVKLDKSLTTTPAGGITINGWVNGDKTINFSVGLDEKTLEPLKGGVLGGKGDSMYKNPEPSENPAALGDYNGFYDSRNYYLTFTDINKLKLQGFDKDITFEQIKQYFEEKEK
ncbi:hypothetical protein OfM1_14780 [Lactovum odontotermitis]